MLSPQEALDFEMTVNICFDNTEYVENWKRLRKVTTWNDNSYRLFIQDVRDLVFDRVGYSSKPTTKSNRKRVGALKL